MKPPTLLIDSDLIGHQSIYAMKEVDLSKDDYKTEIIYNFLMKVRMLAEALHSNKFIFFWDSRKSLLHRKEIYPEYKEGDRSWEKRTEDEKNLLTAGRAQFSVLINEVLPQMGFRNILSEDGYESDDLIARITIGNDQSFVIVSADSDLYQLLEQDRVTMFNPDSRVWNITSAFSFGNKWGIAPEQWADVKAMAGCKSDNVKGIKGVGEKTAIKFLHSDLPAHHKIYSTIMEQKDEVLKTNRPLVTLPYKDTPKPYIQDDELSEKRFIKVFNKFGFRS
ncbi:hypothetical protein LCGC14_2079330, partial [marine sediment metagenome]